jgi:hypothetical protein
MPPRVARCSFPSLVLGCGLLLLLSACGGSSSSSTPYDGPTVTLSGTATYDSVPTTAIDGLDYAATVSRPIRGAIVQVRNASGTSVYFQSSTDENGDFSILAPQSMEVLVMVLAQLGTPGDVTARVVNNNGNDSVSSSYPTYAVYLARTIGVIDEAGVDIPADSGWTGSSYGDARAAAPFAILDVAYRVQQLLLSADADLDIPPLTIAWSGSNSYSSIGTSHYSLGDDWLFILGTEDEDTDEYDDHVIAHELGHWFEDNFSRTDSLGGSHSLDDILDETIAFGEGWGNAFSGMVMLDPHYRDTMAVDQGNTALSMDLEADSISDAAVVDDELDNGDFRPLDGGWSESSIQELLWDCFDGGSEYATETDADGVSLGFGPLYDVLTGAQKTTKGFTTVYSFMAHLKTANPGASAAITALLADENIGAHDEYELTGAGLRRYTSVPSNGVAVTHDVDGDPLATYDTYGAITAQSAGNKLYNRLLFKVTAPSTGTFRFKASPINPLHDVIIYRGGGKTPSTIDDPFYVGAESVGFSATGGQVFTFAVGSYGGATPFTVQFGLDGSVVTAKPEPVVIEEVAPDADG